MSDYQGLNPNPSVGSAGALTGNPQFQKEWEAKQDLEYLDKVAIEAMKKFNIDEQKTTQEFELILKMQNQPTELERVAKIAYKQAQAMLAEKKRIEAAEKEKQNE